MTYVPAPTPMRSTAKSGGGKEGGAASDETASNDIWLRASQISLVGLFVLALIASSYVASAVLLPVMLAWVLATIVLPVVKLIESRGVPRIAASLLVTLLLAILIIALLTMLSNPISVWMGRASEVRNLIQTKLQSIGQPIEALDAIRRALQSAGGATGEPVIRVEQQSSAVVTLFSVVTPALSQFVLCIGALIFYLIYQQKIRQMLVLFVKGRTARLETLRTLTEIDDHMTIYFGTFALVNACLACVTVLLAWGVGLPNPLLWGVLAGVLNFVPYLGPAVVLVALSLAGLLTFSTLADALLAPAIFLAIVGIEGQFVTPTLMGKQLELNPFAVFLAIAFCTWLWGPAGAFVAVPLLMILTLTIGRMGGDEQLDLPA